MVRRVLRENTLAFAGSSKSVRPITGLSCWALGYLDNEYKTVGCLLHPAKNMGEDLRFRVDYGEKCSRESCLEAKTFLELKTSERKFWLSLTDGLDAFSYSSRRFNPLFKLMGWGVGLLQQIAFDENNKATTRHAFFRRYPFFSTGLNPRANAYALRQVIGKCKIDLLKSDAFRVRFEAFSGCISVRLKDGVFPSPEAPYTHLLGLDRQFLDFLRLSAGISRIEAEEALRLKEIVDTAITEFKSEESDRIP